MLLLLLLRRRRGCLQACMPGAEAAGGALWFSLMLAYSLPAGGRLDNNEIVVIPEDAFRYNTALKGDMFAPGLCVAGAGWLLCEGRGVGDEEMSRRSMRLRGSEGGRRWAAWRVEGGEGLLLLLMWRRRRRCLQACMPGAAGGGGALWFSLMLAYSPPAGGSTTTRSW